MPPAPAAVPEIAPVERAFVEQAVAPAPVVTTSQKVAQSNDNVLPIAGAAGAGILALAGAAFALGRRRKNADEVDNQISAEAVAVPEAAPAHVLEEPAPLYAERSPIVAEQAPSQSIDGPVTALPRGFDVSRYGRHVQAAYRGPTADNPSLSLRNRLKHARFYDLRERQGLAVATPESRDDVDAAARSTQSAATPRRDYVVSRPASWPNKTSFKPAFQS